jgi:mannose-6-phosphate isomerase-like protein (cupin superfamily)
VVSGIGVALVNEDWIELRERTPLFIQRGDWHEIWNTGQTLLKTLNIYVPPAYTEEGEELPAGRG